MSEPRKNHLNIDGGQVKEDDHVASYKPIPEAETEFRSSKSNLSKSKEKVSLDGAEEKLLAKEEEAKIVTRVDMADAKYVVGDHRNGDAKIELDANKRQFSGLTKEELLKYADDPFWVRLRWFLFVLFWAMWLCMLAGAIIIIVRAPKCAAPEPKTWFEKGPLVDMENTPLADVEKSLPLLQSSLVRGVFVDAPAYDALQEQGIVDKFRTFISAAKGYGVKVILDLTPGFVTADHPWFGLSENRTGDYASYFVWAKGDGFTANGTKPILNMPNNWVSTSDTPAWSYSESRGEYYLHHNGDNKPDLDFNNPAVVALFERVLDTWMKAGAAGVRLSKARLLFVNSSMSDESPAMGAGAARGADHTRYEFWKHRHSADRPQLDALLARWAGLVKAAAAATDLSEPVFTIEEEERLRPELFLQRGVPSLRPAAAAPLRVSQDVVAFAADIKQRLGRWPLMQLVAPAEMESELAPLALLLPAAPVLRLRQLARDNDTSARDALSRVAALRGDASLEHGNYSVQAVPPRGSTDYKLIACARWKADHAGYVAVFNPSAAPLRANLTALPSVPDALTLYHASHAAKLYHNYSMNMVADDVFVPPNSTVVLNYVPQTEAKI